MSRSEVTMREVLLAQMYEKQIDLMADQLNGMTNQLDRAEDEVARLRKKLDHIGEVNGMMREALESIAWQNRETWSQQVATEALQAGGGK